MVKLEWEGSQPPRAKRQYAFIFEALKTEQKNNPGMWAEIARYESIGTSRQAVNRLRKQYASDGFDVRSSIDQGTREGVVYARYNTG